MAVALGGALGASIRYAIGLWIIPAHPGAWPLATLLINISGSALLGAITVFATETGQLSMAARLFLTIGVCGGFTTFSTFAYETLDFAVRGLPLRAAGYAAASVVCCVTATFGGGAAGQWLARA
jgi:CrcB protein